MRVHTAWIRFTCVHALVLSAAVAACTPTASSSPDASAPVTPCDSCAAAQCASQNAACAANADCQAINDCVAMNSSCVGARMDDPLCDDDCVKMVCIAKHPNGGQLYYTTQQCQTGAQCGVCMVQCASAITQNRKCVLGPACNVLVPNPDDCKCLPRDGGPDGMPDGMPGGGDGSNTCNAKPTCDLASANDVNMALGTSVGAATTKITSGAVQLTRCQYGATPGPQINYWVPYSMSDYLAGRANLESTLMVGTTTVPNLGDAAFYAVVGQNGVETLVVLKGCVQFQITATASSDQLIALAKVMLMKL